MLKAIHAQESKKAAREKAQAVVWQLRAMKLKEATATSPFEHWTRIRTNNVIERLNREIRRRTRVVDAFPDGNSALMLVCAHLRYVAGTQCGNKTYMNMKHLEADLKYVSITGLLHSLRDCIPFCETFLTLPFLMLRRFSQFIIYLFIPIYRI